MVGINYDSLVLKIVFVISFTYCNQVFIVIVWNAETSVVDESAKDGMCKVVAQSFNFPASVDEFVR